MILRRLLLTVLLAAPASAQQGPAIPLSLYTRQLARMQILVAQCRQTPTQCLDTAIPADSEVQANPTFEQRWDWLRIAVERARDPKDSARLTLLDSAAQRLADDTLLATRSTPPPAIEPARTRADSILNQAQFRRVQRAGYLQRKLAAFWFFVDRLFSGAAGLIPRSPWFATLLEWGILAAAIIALVLWAWRLNQQQRLAVITHTHTSLAPWQKESEDWAARARQHAQRGDWREAVHSLYWSAIVLLEGQKLWRPNRARTPREYLPLLEPGSARRAALTSLTRTFERIWYGQRPASAADYTQAEALLDRLRSA